MNSTVIQSSGSLCYRKMSLNEALQASECKQLSAHNFIGFCLQTTSTVQSRCCDVDYHFDLSLCRPVPYAGRWRRWDVEQSPFTVVDTGLCGRRPPLLSKAYGSLRSFSLTGTIF